MEKPETEISELKNPSDMVASEFESSGHQMAGNKAFDHQYNGDSSQV